MTVKKAASTAIMAKLVPEGTSAKQYLWIALGIFLFCLLGISSRPMGALSTLWPANALMLGIFLHSPHLASPLGWCSAATAYVLADLLTGNDLLTTLLLNSTNFVGVGVALAVSNRLGHVVEKSLNGPFNLTTLFLSIVAASLASGMAGGIVLWLLQGQPIWFTAAGWVVSELLCYTIFLPCILSMPRPSAWRIRERRISQRKYAPLVMFIVALLAAVIIGGPGALAFPLLALLACALSYGIFATSLLTLVASLWTLIVTSSGNILHIATTGDIYALLSIRFGVASIALAPIVVAYVTAAQENSLKALRYMAEHDALTGLLNRRTFRQRAGDTLAQLHEKGKPVAVLMIDIDHFKNINDTYGHAAGDEALRETAQRLRAVLRREDLCGRIGGEEFLVLIPECTPYFLKDITQRIHAAIRHEVLLPHTQQPLTITVSIGATLCDPAPPLLEPMLLQADKALYTAKEQGRNRTRLT